MRGHGVRNTNTKKGGREMTLREQYEQETGVRWHWDYQRYAKYLECHIATLESRAEGEAVDKIANIRALNGLTVEEKYCRICDILDGRRLSAQAETKKERLVPGMPAANEKTRGEVSEQFSGPAQGNGTEKKEG
jgi:hypothetical protein